VEGAGRVVTRAADEPLPETTEASADPEPWAVGAGVGVPVAAVAIPPAVAMTAVVTAMSVMGRIRMNPCPFLRVSG
ncbi:hypothetical protein ACFV97_35590, partial [Streptomyces sp. NPDC059913]|uniref:hypothetical protein n=1 Tax=Streptomyces sp. NPDC059913 TaxID=3346999 RepID=UPI003669D664